MKKVLALVLALGMTSTAFGMENVRDAERDQLGAVGIQFAGDNKFMKEVAKEVAKLIIENEAATGEFEHEDDNGRGR